MYSREFTRVFEDIQVYTREHKGIKGSIRVFKGIKVLKAQGGTKVMKGVQGYSRVYKGIECVQGYIRVLNVYKGAQGYSRVCKGTEGYTRVYKGIVGCTKRYSRVYKGIQRY